MGGGILDRVEAAHNFASDTKFVWYPFKFLRVKPSQPLSFSRRLVMTCFFGSFAGIIMWLKACMFGDRLFADHCSADSLMRLCLRADFVFFVWFNTVTAFFWNRRAKRLISATKDQLVSS